MTGQIGLDKYLAGMGCPDGIIKECMTDLTTMNWQKAHAAEHSVELGYSLFGRVPGSVETVCVWEKQAALILELHHNWKQPEMQTKCQNLEAGY